MCQSGYHASPTPWEALAYAPGGLLCLVELGEDARAFARGEIVAAAWDAARAAAGERQVQRFNAMCYGLLGIEVMS